MEGLTGLNGLTGYQVDYFDAPEASAEERMGGSADSKHGSWGEQAHPYPWESSLTGQGGMHGPYGPENQLLGDPDWVLMSGGDITDDPIADETPSHRAGPFPKGIASGPLPGEGPDAIANQLVQSFEIHGIKTGAARRAIHSQMGYVLNDEWQDSWDVQPGTTLLEDTNRQAKGASFQFGTTDRTQSYARQNEYGFDASHAHRRWATGAIPGNTMWMKPGGRPLAKSLPTTARMPTGIDSPFHGDDTSFDFNPYGAVLMNTPTEYVPPPTVNLANPSQNAAGPGDVEFF
jgi:hypothetical protein